MTEHDNVVVEFPRQKRPDSVPRRVQVLLTLSIAMLCVLFMTTLLAACSGMHKERSDRENSTYGDQKPKPTEEAPTRKTRERETAVKSAEAGQRLNLGGLRFSATGFMPDLRVRWSAPLRAVSILEKMTL